MDLGELPTRIESPLIPVLLWAVLAVLVSLDLVIMIISVRRGPHRGVVVVIASALLILGLGVGMLVWHRYAVAGLFSPDLCPYLPDGIYFDGEYTMLGENTLLDEVRRCLEQQYRLAAEALGGFALATAAGGCLQLRVSRITNGRLPPAP